MKSIQVKHGHVNVNGQLFNELTCTLELPSGEPVSSAKNSPSSFPVKLKKGRRDNLFEKE